MQENKEFLLNHLWSSREEKIEADKLLEFNEDIASLDSDFFDYLCTQNGVAVKQSDGKKVPKKDRVPLLAEKLELRAKPKAAKRQRVKGIEETTKMNLHRYVTLNLQSHHTKNS